MGTGQPARVCPHNDLRIPKPRGDTPHPRPRWAGAHGPALDFESPGGSARGHSGRLWWLLLLGGWEYGEITPTPHIMATRAPSSRASRAEGVLDLGRSPGSAGRRRPQGPEGRGPGGTPESVADPQGPCGLSSRGPGTQGPPGAPAPSLPLLAPQSAPPLLRSPHITAPGTSIPRFLVFNTVPAVLPVPGPGPGLQVGGSLSPEGRAHGASLASEKLEPADMWEALAPVLPAVLRRPRGSVPSERWLFCAREAGSGLGGGVKLEKKSNKPPPSLTTGEQSSREAGSSGPFLLPVSRGSLRGRGLGPVIPDLRSHLGEGAPGGLC